MGYTTEFDGSFMITPPLNEFEIEFMHEFSETRRMNRRNGPLFVKGSGYAGQGNDPDIIDYNGPHPDQPGLWCQWEVVNNGSTLRWNGAEKFYAAELWLAYLIENLLSSKANAYLNKHADNDARLMYFTCDHDVHGFVYATGEDDGDQWTLGVSHNKVLVDRTGHVRPN